jgi:hypothetical protein
MHHNHDDEESQAGSLPDSGPARETTLTPSLRPLESALRAQRVQDIRIMLEQGDYRIPTRKLAPILARIFLTMNKPEDNRHEGFPPD